VESSETIENNWGVTVSVEFGADVIGFGSTVTLDKSVGGSTARTHSETESFAEVTANSGSMTKTFNAPGASLIFGFVNRYKIDESQASVKMYYECSSSDNDYTKISEVHLEVSSYQEFNYKSMTGIYYKDACVKDPAVTHCVDKLQSFYGLDLVDYTEVSRNFSNCFDDEKGYIF